MGDSPLLGLAFFASSSVKINSDRSISKQYSYTCITRNICEGGGEGVTFLQHRVKDKNRTFTFVVDR